MTDAHAAAAPQGQPAHPHVDYVKIWAILCGLLVASVAGTFTGIFWVTMVAAFGIALVKAYLVAKNFMQLDIEKRFVVYMLVTMLALMALMFAGVSPDVMPHRGHRWINTAAEDSVKRGMVQGAAGEHGSEHGHE
jgi:caa(3)-type oxidase subunit IV